MQIHLSRTFTRLWVIGIITDKYVLCWMTDLPSYDPIAYPFRFDQLILLSAKLQLQFQS
jgi:hypothetical protein